MVRGCELNLTGSEQEPMVGSRENGREPSSSINNG